MATPLMGNPLRPSCFGKMEIEPDSALAPNYKKGSDKEINEEGCVSCQVEDFQP
jgi:hypothetical protein